MSITKKNWGNTTWAFLHTFAEKINPRFYEANTSNILQLIRRICINLPCPECSNHANSFFNKVYIGSIATHSQFKYMLWTFHNSVNHRLGSPVQSQQIMNEYKTYPMSTALIDFKRYYAERYNTHIELGHGNNDKLRIRITNDVIGWIQRYWNAFS
jgi:hypothetical protein